MLRSVYTALLYVFAPIALAGPAQRAAQHQVRRPDRGGQGNHLGGGYATATRAAAGMTYGSNALAQEKTGEFWVTEQGPNGGDEVNILRVSIREECGLPWRCASGASRT